MPDGVRGLALLAILSMVAGAASGCGLISPTQPPTSPPPSANGAASSPSGFVLASSAFSDGAAIPKQYSCDGENVSPPLEWHGAPAQTQSYALIVDDPDAPSGNFTHWAVFDISKTTSESPEAAKNFGRAAQNGRGQIGYTGPCPPGGTHRYFFTLYALDTASLGIGEGSTRAEVENAIKGHILAKTVLLGRYSR